MKMKPALKYLLSDYKSVLLIMYLCVYLIIIFLIPHNKIRNSGTGGLEFVSLITVFVLGISSWKPYFKLFSANGVSRRTLLCSAIKGLGVVAIILSLIDTLNALLVSSFTNYQSLFIQSYYRIHVEVIDNEIVDNYSTFRYTFQMLAQQFMWSIFAYFWIAMIGLLITTLYYRMNKGLKIAVSVGVPALWLFALPSLDQRLWGNELSHATQAFFNFAWGFSNGYNPYIGMASMFVFAAIAAALSWLLVRRAGIKQ